LLVGISLDQACIDCKAFAPHETGCNARLDDPFEYTAENLSLAESARYGRAKRQNDPG
jgi:hypothetical protein